MPDPLTDAREFSASGPPLWALVGVFLILIALLALNLWKCTC